MEISDVLGLGKVLPIDKLIDIVAKSFGKLSKPYFDRKAIDTEAYRIKTIANAKAQEIKIISTALNENSKLLNEAKYKDEKFELCSTNISQLPLNASIEDRAQNRLNFQEIKQQENIESITAFAAEELKNEPPVTDEKLDEDWTTRFFRIAEDISNEEMQALWGKILAGEIKQPKTYSLRTLELIRNLSKQEADIFRKVADFAIKGKDTYFLFNGPRNILTTKYNIPYTYIALLTEIGLLQPGESVVYQILKQPKDSQTIFTCGETIIFVNTKNEVDTISIPITVFSNSGKELLQLLKSNPPFDYLSSFAKSISNPNIDVKYATIVTKEGNLITHTNPLKTFT